MSNYIVVARQFSPQRGSNRTVTVWRIENNEPVYVGHNDRINTSSYKGDHAIACEVISEVDGHEMTADGYHLLDKDIKVISVH